MEVPVLSRGGEPTGRVVELSSAVFELAEPNDHVIYLDVKQYLADQRQGTAKTRERSEMSGSTRKLKRQKGTGGARSGDINSPIFRGGARVFGPVPRSYRTKLNKQVKVLARMGAFTYKAKAGKVVVVEDLKFEAPSTKEFIKLCQALKVSDQKVLLLTEETDRVLYLSSRNLRGVKVSPYYETNTYSILDAQVLVLTESAVKSINEDYKEEA